MTKADAVHFPPDIFTFPALLWAKATCGSRAFPAALAGGRNGIHATADFLLCPLLDAANHRTGAPMEWKGVEYCVGEVIEFRVPPGCRNSLRAGEEVWNDYGPHGTEDFLMNYGFCPEGNLHEKIELSFVVSGNMEALDTRAANLQRRNLPVDTPRRYQDGPGRVYVGPFVISRARCATSENAKRKLRLPPSFLASFFICAGGDDSVAPGTKKGPVLQELLLTLITELAQSFPSKGDFCELEKQHVVSLHRWQQCQILLNGQRTLLQEAVAAVEALSDNDLYANIKRLDANAAFLDRLSGGSDASKASEEAARNQGERAMPAVAATTGNGCDGIGRGRGYLEHHSASSSAKTACSYDSSIPPVSSAFPSVRLCFSGAVQKDKREGDPLYAEQKEQMLQALACAISNASC